MDVVLARLRRVTPVALPEEIAKAEHMGLAYIAAALRQHGSTVEIVDGEVRDLPVGLLCRQILALRPQVVGVSVTDVSEIGDCLVLARQIKEAHRQVHVTTGGHTATFSARELLSSGDVDSVVMYEGDETIVELCGKVVDRETWRNVKGIAYMKEDRLVFTGGRERPDVESLPFAARDTLVELKRGNKQFIASVISSRGCPKNCTFCTNRRFFGEWRARSAKNVVDEIEELVHRHAVKSVDFQDATFVGPGEMGRRRAQEIADELMNRRLRVRFRISCTVDSVDLELFRHLKDAGLCGVNVGIESGVQSALDHFQKGTTVRQNVRALRVLRRLGLLQRSTIGFIMFRPSSTLAEIQRNVRFLKKHVTYINPADLTNTLTIAFPKLPCKSGRVWNKEDRDRDGFNPDVRLARAGFNIIAAHFLPSYYVISHVEGGCRKKALEKWSNKVIDLSIDFLNAIKDANADEVGEVRALLQRLNAQCSERAIAFSSKLPNTRRNTSRP